MISEKAWLIKLQFPNKEPFYWSFLADSEFIAKYELKRFLPKTCRIISIKRKFEK